MKLSLLSPTTVIEIVLTSMFFAVSCTTAPQPITPPRPSLAEFQERILLPLAKQKADDRIRQVKAEVEYRAASGKGWGDLLTVLGGLVGSAGTLGLGTAAGAGIGKGIGNVIETTSEQQKQKDLAWVETQRIPLEQKYFDLLAGRARLPDDKTAFIVCLDGKERRYSADDSFRRLENGPGPCPWTNITLPEAPR